MSALTRIAYGDHTALTVEPGRHRRDLGEARPRQRAPSPRLDQPARSAGRFHEEIAAVHVARVPGGAAYERLVLLRPRYVMPIHGEYRMRQPHGRLARGGGVPEDTIAENGGRSSSSHEAVRGWRAGSVRRDVRRYAWVTSRTLHRRSCRLADDGAHRGDDARLLGGEIAPRNRARFRRVRMTRSTSFVDEADRVVRELAAGQILSSSKSTSTTRWGRSSMTDAPPAHGPSGGDRGLHRLGDGHRGQRRASSLPHVVSWRNCARVRRPRWPSAASSSAGGGVMPCPRRPAPDRPALRHAADPVETALAGLERPLSQYLLELEPERAEGRSWYAGPEQGSSSSGVPSSIGPASAPARTVLRPSISSWPSSSALSKDSPRPWTRHPIVPSSWLAFFDLHTLLGSTVDDLRALAA